MRNEENAEEHLQGGRRKWERAPRCRPWDALRDKDMGEGQGGWERQDVERDEGG
jgi:hypothetical protein